MTNDDLTLFGIFSHLRVEKCVAVIGSGVVLIWMASGKVLPESQWGGVPKEEDRMEAPHGYYPFGNLPERALNILPKIHRNQINSIPKHKGQ